MHVCMYVCMYIYIHIYTHTRLILQPKARVISIVVVSRTRNEDVLMVVILKVNMIMLLKWLVIWGWFWECLGDSGTVLSVVVEKCSFGLFWSVLWRFEPSSVGPSWFWAAFGLVRVALSWAGLSWVGLVWANLRCSRMVWAGLSWSELVGAGLSRYNLGWPGQSLSEPV